MKTLGLRIIAVLGLALAGCAGLESRVQEKQAEFATWPAAVQTAVRAGKIDLGFTTGQVYVALGNPDRIFVRQTAESVEDVWAYFSRKPGFSMSAGMATGGYAGVSGAAVYERRDDRLDEADRVIFKGGKVVAIEQRTR
ncbi:MAG: hypothetical protein ACHQ4G_07265 [Opitutales bacterium]